MRGEVSEEEFDMSDTKFGEELVASLEEAVAYAEDATEAKSYRTRWPPEQGARRAKSSTARSRELRR